MRRIITSSLIVALVTVMIAAPASAGRHWCRADPIISFDGQPVQIWVEIPAEYQYLVNGPILFDVTTPAWANSQVLFTDAGFNGYGEVIRFNTAQHDNQHGPGQDDPGRNDKNGQPALVVEIVAQVPFDHERLLRDFGIENTTQVPMRMRIIDAYGVEQVVHGTIDQTVISVVVRDSAHGPA